MFLIHSNYLKEEVKSNMSSSNSIVRKLTSREWKVYRYTFICIYMHRHMCLHTHTCTHTYTYTQATMSPQQVSPVFLFTQLFMISHKNIESKRKEIKAKSILIQNQWYLFTEHWIWRSKEQCLSFTCEIQRYPSPIWIQL